MEFPFFYREKTSNTFAKSDLLGCMNSANSGEMVFDLLN